MPRHIMARERLHACAPRCEPTHAEILEFIEEISERLARIEEKLERP